MARPEFDSIKTFKEFKKYKWNRSELADICKDHGLLFIGTEKKLNGVIEAYFNGVRIPPRRNWYTNKKLVSFVNENGFALIFDLVLALVSATLIVIGIINRIRGIDDIYSVPYIVFGAPGFVFAIVGIQVGRDIDVIKSFFPVCGDRRFSRAQVDEQANSVNAKPLNYGEIILAPDMLIGVSAGVAAVAYEDIASLQVRQTWHTRRIGPRYSSRYEDYYIYKITVRTQKGRHVVISRSESDAETAVKSLYEHCLKYNSQVKLLKMRKSSLAPDDSAKQVISGKDIVKKVNLAVEKQLLRQIAVSGDLKEQFVSYHRNSALILIPESLLVFAIGAGLIYLMLRFLHTVRGAYFPLICVLFPGYAVYNLFSTLINIRKDDIEFYYGRVIDKCEKGYRIEGLDSYYFGYIRKMKPDTEPDIGDLVVIARFKDEFSLIGTDNWELIT